MLESTQIYLYRDKCVLCFDVKLVPFIELKNFPIKCILEKNEQLYKWNMKLGSCEICGSVQQMNLLDPDILYRGYSYNNQHSIIWKDHHEMLSKFIINNITKDKPIIEIGSSFVSLVDKLINDFKDYTIFDYSLDTIKNKLPYLKYIEGNCETYMFPSKSVLVMSHVFEHLYNPKQFLENCETNNVEDIIISIPNMNNNNLITITREHTYTYNSADIEYLFNTYGYYLKKMNIQGDNFSIFYHFNRLPSSPLENRFLNPNKYLSTYTYFNKKYTVPQKSVITTAGFWGQVLYNNITNKNDIIAVIDNDPIKQGKIFNGTELTINKSLYLNNFGNDTTAIIIKGFFWSDEVASTIRKHNKDIQIMYL